MANTRPSIPGALDGRARILVVDDDEDMRVWLQTLLEDDGYLVEAVDGARAAYARLERGGITAVILDILMPEIDGFAALETLRSSYPPKLLPILVLSARDSGDDVIRALRLGANDYALKGGDWDSLRSRLRLHLNLKVGSGKLIGRFEICGCLGKGGMGSVYRARDPRRGTTEIALKVLPRELMITPETRKRFKREADVLSRVDHPNVVRYLESGISDEAPYLAMELVAGENLAKRRVAHSEILGICRQIAEGLAAIHALDVLHRDIKPHNVVLGNDRRARIVDLGIAKDLKSTAITRFGMSMGSLAYSAPEQLRGHADHRSDIYGLGATAFYLYTNKQPTDTMAPKRWWQKTQRVVDLRELCPSASRKEARLVAQLMHPDPDQRFRDCAAVLAAIDKARR